MYKNLFGTDGIRGYASDEIFNHASLNFLAKAIINNKKSFKVLIGIDTRISSKIIEKKLVDNLKNNGAYIYLTGILPTPAVSYLTKKFNCNLGIVISASHNPYKYNGIKFFNKNGEKLLKHQEKAIEKKFFKFKKEGKFVKKKSERKIKKIKNSNTIYIKKIISILKKKKLSSKLKVVVDCANGSTYKISKYVFSNLKVKCFFIKNKPNGRNINYKCGSLYPNVLSEEVKKRSADFGISFDGDGDRVICCDEQGKIIDGDKIIACLAKYFVNTKSLKINSVIGTLMSNRGLELYIKSIGLKFYRAKVGDKFVYELIKKKKCLLGGEQSGHIILKNYGPSGDGLFIGLYLIKIILDYGEKASKLFNLYNSHFQIQKNIIFKDSNYKKNIKIRALSKSYNNKIVNNSRVLVRKSGTEPMIRLLVEGKKINEIKLLSQKIEKEIKKSI